MTSYTPRFWRLTLSEWLTFATAAASLVVAAASLLVSIQSARQARDNSDIRAAIGNLSALAKETKRQADYSSQQVALLQSQATDSKDQTRAIAQQTIAITGSAVATTRSADAQRVMADATVNAQKPRFALRALDFSGLGGAANAQGFVEVSLNFTFKNTGGTPAIIKAVRYDIRIAPELPPEMPLMGLVRGNDLPVTPSLDSALSPSEAIKFNFPKDLIDALVAQQARAFFVGKIEFADLEGTLHTQCFSYVLTIKDNQSTYFAPVHGPSYQCLSRP